MRRCDILDARQLCWSQLLFQKLARMLQRLLLDIADDKASAIAAHLSRGGLDDGLVFDAVRVRLIEIGEAVKDIDQTLLAKEPAVLVNGQAMVWAVLEDGDRLQFGDDAFRFERAATSGRR